MPPRNRDGRVINIPQITVPNRSAIDWDLLTQEVNIPTASEMEDLRRVFESNTQERLNQQVTEQVTDSLMGNVPTTDMEYARIHDEFQRSMAQQMRIDTPTLHRDDVMDAEGYDSVTRLQHGDIVPTTDLSIGEPVYLDQYIPEGMSQQEYSARRRAGETFERPMTVRERAQERSRQADRIRSRQRRRVSSEQEKEKEMASRDITVLNVTDMYRTDMREKYHRLTMPTRHPLNVFKDAVTVVNRIQNSRAGDSIENKSFLSPNIANLTLSSTDVLSLREFIDLTGLNVDRINRNIRRIRERGLDVVFIGYGGMSINMLHFMESIKKHQTGNPLFSSLTIYEPDKLSLTNMFRVYKDCSKINGSIEQSEYKTKLFTERGIADRVNIVNNYFTEEDANNWNSNTIFIGAPDFGTREILKNRRFFFVGHGDNEISITYQPSTEHDMTIETYGKIDVRILWSNLLSATEAMFEILANAKFDELEPNTEVFVNNAYETKSSNKQRATSSDRSTF